MFHKKGDIVVPESAAKEDELMDIVLEAGAEDLRTMATTGRFSPIPPRTKPCWRR